MKLTHKLVLGCLLILPFSARASTIVTALTNWDQDAPLLTNTVKITQVGPIRSDGTYGYVGIPRFDTGTTNGFYTNHLNQGNYEAQIVWSAADLAVEGFIPPKPILFDVPNDSMTYTIWDRQISGGNVFVTRVVNTNGAFAGDPNQFGTNGTVHLKPGATLTNITVATAITLKPGAEIDTSNWTVDSDGNFIIASLDEITGGNFQLFQSGSAFFRNTVTASHFVGDAAVTNDTRAVNLTNANNQFAGYLTNVTSFSFASSPTADPLQLDTNVMFINHREHIAFRSNSAAPVSAFIGDVFGAHSDGDGSELEINSQGRIAIGSITGSDPGLIQVGGPSGNSPTSLSMLEWKGGDSPSSPFGLSSIFGLGYTFWTGVSRAQMQSDHMITAVDSTGHGTETWFDGFLFSSRHDNPIGVARPRLEKTDNVGVKVYGTSMLDTTNVALGVATGYAINMGQRWSDVQMGGNITVGISNINALFYTVAGTTSGLESDVVFYPGTFTYTIAFSNSAVNLIWENEAGTAAVPTTVGPSKTLHLHILLDVAQNATNAHIRYAQGTYSPTLDPDAVKLFTMLVTAGTVSSSQSNAINSWFVSAKQNNYFTNLLYFYGMVGTNTNQCSWNWLNTNTFRLAYHGTFGATNFLGTGIWGNASDFWMDTGFTPSTSMATITNGMYGCYVRSTSQPTTSAYFFSETDNSGGSIRAGVGSLDSTHVNIQGLNVNQNNTQFMGFTTDASGFMGVNLQGTSQDGYFKSALNNNATVTATARPSSSMPLLALWDRTSADGNMNAQLDIAVAGQFMTQAKMTAMIADIITLNSGLGR